MPIDRFVRRLAATLALTLPLALAPAGPVSGTARSSPQGEASVANELRAPSSSQPARPADHVIVISIDGFHPATYLDAERHGYEMPTLAALSDAGSHADGAIVSAPSLTYPSHTSLATGVRPARHGIVSNTIFDPGTGSQMWYFEARHLRVPALWDLARGHGLTTAGVSWPVTVGATMDVLYPETNQAPRHMSWLALARQQSTPGLIDTVVERLGGFGENDNRDPVQRDRFAAAVATHVIRAHQPHLLMVHLMQTDSAQHAHGPHSPEAREAFANVDAHLAAIVRATEEAGMRERTAFVVSGDHGFYRIHSVFQPNVILRRAGLLTTNERDRLLAWRALAHGLAIRVDEPANAELVERVATLFEDLARGQYRGLFRVVRRAELDEHGAYPDAAFFLEPAEGYYVSDGFADDAFLVASNRRGAHGYLPTDPALHTGFVASGAGVARGVPLAVIRQIDIAPTVARLLGFELPDADGVPLVGLVAAPGAEAAR